MKNLRQPQKENQMFIEIALNGSKNLINKKGEI